MYNISFFKKMLVLAGVIFLYSCDKDYNVIGGDIISDNNFVFTKYTSNVIAYTQKTGPIQSNNLPVNALGIIDNPVFGKTTANFATQLALATANPTIGEAPEIGDVYLTIPYFSRVTTTNADGSHVYKLDSIYGVDKAKIKLSIYESGHPINSLSGSGESQLYFTNQNSDFDNAKVGSSLNDAADSAQNGEFFFDNKEFSETTKDLAGNDVVTRTPPGMRLKLNSDFFKNKILNAPAGSLATNDVFLNYFKGLYFKVENATGSSGSMAMLDFKKGKITINYKAKTAITTDADDVKEQKTLVLNLTGNTVSLLNNDFGSSGVVYGGLPYTGNTTEGDEKLYLKGGEGSMAVLNLFSTPNQLNEIRSNGWLINEANLVFHIDAEAMKNSYEPSRIYLYDLDKNIPLVDFTVDATTSFYPKKSKYVFDGNLNKQVIANGRGLTYKIRITDHIKNLIKNTSAANVKLGLVVTEDVFATTSYKWKTPINVIPEVAPYGFQTPVSGVMSPLGTVLYGSKSTVADDKRLKLEIFYTKPN